MLGKLSAALALLVLAVPAAAQQREPDPAALDAARDLLAASDFEAQVESSSRQVVEATITTMLAELEAQHGEPYPAALEDEIRQILREHNEALLAEMRPTMLEESARIYARYFTAEELLELRRLQSHPVMVKFQRIAPQFTTEMSQIGVAEATRRLPELQRRIAEAMADWERRSQLPAQAPST